MKHLNSNQVASKAEVVNEVNVDVVDQVVNEVEKIQELVSRLGSPVPPMFALTCTTFRLSGCCLVD